MFFDAPIATYLAVLFKGCQKAAFTTVCHLRASTQYAQYVFWLASSLTPLAA